MRKAAFGIFLMLAAVPAWGQAPGAPPAAKAARTAAAAAPQPASGDLRPAPVMATSPEPTFDENTYARLKDALLSYSSLQVRGGWPALPADAKLAPGASGPAVALLRRRLVITEDLAADKQLGDTYEG